MCSMTFWQPAFRTSKGEFTSKEKQGLGKVTAEPLLRSPSVDDLNYPSMPRNRAELAA